MIIVKHKTWFQLKANISKHVTINSIVKLTACINVQ
jgi:hypothetical protein